MLTIAPSGQPLPWSRKVISRIFAAVTSGYRVRLDFPDGQQVVLGPANRPIDVALCPPTFWQTLWIFLRPGLRAGESFMRGEWAITQGDLATFLRIVQIPRAQGYMAFYLWFSDWRGPIFFFRQRVVTEWNRRRAAQHYDFGNDLYARMLDATEQYSCAFFSLSKSDDLESAQQAKLTASIERLHLDRPKLKILDIGCGWGSLAAELAKSPGDHDVFGITLSQEQLKGALARRDGLPAHVKQRLHFSVDDYRYFLAQPTGEFDRIVSIGMFEHVGLGRHIHFFKSIASNLAPDGRALVHSIVRPWPGAPNEWIRRYIFPGSFLPSVAEMVSGAERSGLIVDAVHIHPPSDYRKTIQAWRRRIEAAWPDIERENAGKYDATFKRMWLFYLASVEPIFSEDFMNFRIAQIELRKICGPLNSSA
jgi:cyclopropane-fatty-acyl-phospholipid synthase